MLIYNLVRSKSDDTEVAFEEVFRLDLDRILPLVTLPELKNIVVSRSWAQTNAQVLVGFVN